MTTKIQYSNSVPKSACIYKYKVDTTISWGQEAKVFNYRDGEDCEEISIGIHQEDERI